jgi:hypothetical protein
MIGRLLCRLGRHRFDYRIMFNFGSWDECARCGTRR